MRQEISENIKKIKMRISEAARRVGRDEGEITIVCVTKGVGIEKIREAELCGMCDFGENYWQEAKEKISAIGLDKRWHFIGHLQRNKVKYVVPNFYLIHSLDSVELASEISKYAEKINKIQNLLIQVKTSYEETKYGINPDELLDFIDRISNLKGIRIMGLMTIAPLTENPEETRALFRRTKNLYDEIKKIEEPNLSTQYLSMGMTQDFEVAVEESANILRIGTGIFGERR